MATDGSFFLFAASFCKILEIRSFIVGKANFEMGYELEQVHYFICYFILRQCRLKFGCYLEIQKNKLLIVN